MQQNPPSLLQLFLRFFWFGLTAFGGPAMYVHIRKKVVEKRKWMDAQSFDAGLALCQVIPGAIVMQLAAYVGLKLRGKRGAIVCFVGFGLPAFLIMLTLSILYKQAKNISTVEAILSSLRIVIIAMIAYAAYSFGKKNFRTINDVVIATIAAFLFLTRLHPAIVLGLSSLLGLLLSKPNSQIISETGKTNTTRFFFSVLFIVIILLGVLFIVDRNYFVLATIMLRVDLFSFGGGLAAVPIMVHELVDLFGWFDQKTFLDGIILGQVTPGSIIISATFFGYMHFGFWGSVLATICVFIPSFLILMGIVPFFDKLRTYPQFNKVINGILCSFVGLLVVITYHFAIEIHWKPSSILLTSAAFIALLLKIDAIWIVIAGILLALVF